MNKLLAIFVLLAVWLQAFYQVVIVAQYYANKDYISKNLCENRNKPQMHCDGKCCLKKKLAKESKQQAPGPQNSKDEQVVLFFNDTKLSLHSGFTDSAPVKYFVANDNRTSTFHSSIFHPPGRLMFA